MAADNVIPLHPRKPFTFDPENMSGKYILVDRVPVPEPDLFKWGRWMEVTERRVDRTMVEGIRVSTVFLGLDHGFGGKGPPLIFETMVFGGEHNYYQERCCTWDEAEAMHAEAVKLAKKGGKVPSYEWWRRMMRKRLDKFRSKPDD